MLYRFSRFRFDPTRQELIKGSERVSLPTALNTLLELFVSRAGEIVTRQEIADAIWEDQYSIDIENGINGLIRRLRLQLSTESGEEQCLATVIGKGYRFLPEVTEETAEAEADVQVETQAGTEGDEPRKRFSPRVWISVAAVAALCGVVAGVIGWRMQGGTVARPQSFALSWTQSTFERADDKLNAQAVSPSGAMLAVSDGTGVWASGQTPGPTVRFALPEGFEANHLSWFPDEKHLLVSGQRLVSKEGSARRQEAWVVGTGDVAPRLLLQEAALATVSPDGQRLAYVQQGQSELWVADADGQHTLRLVAAQPGEVVGFVLWSPDGSRLIVDRRAVGPGKEAAVENGALAQLEQEEIGMYESYDARSGRLLARQDNLRFDSAALLPDGRLIFPLRDGDVYRLKVVRTNQRTGAVVGGGETETDTVAKQAYHVSNLTASRDGHRISAIVVRRSIDVYMGDLRMGAGDGVSLANVRRFTYQVSTGYPTSWSADDSQVILDDSNGAKTAVAMQEVSTGVIKVLADVGGRAVQGQVTPDGRWVLFLHYVGKPTHVQSIDRVPIGGGKAEVVYASPNILDYRCSRAAVGRCVVRETDGVRALVYSSLDPVKGKGAELVRRPWEQNALGDWSLSPDGTMAVKAQHDPAHPGVALFSLDGKKQGKREDAVEETPVPGYGTVLGATWAVDSKGYFVQAHSDTGYALLYVSRTKRAQLLLRSDLPIWASPSRDGNYIAFPADTPSNRNVWTGVVD